MSRRIVYRGVCVVVLGLAACGALAWMAPASGIISHGSYQNSAESAKIITKKMGSVVLRIPQGYFSSTDISAAYGRHYDYAKLTALLPCLLPETAQNTLEFHANTFGSVVSITLGGGDTGLVGQEMLNAETKIYPFEEANSRNANFLWYKDNLLSLDTYVLKDSDPVLIAECDMHSKYVPFPSCSVRERIWGDVLLEYIYDRRFIDKDLDRLVSIDSQVHRLLDSFLNSSPDNIGTTERNFCK